MRLDARLAGQWTPTELGVHPVAGGGPLPAYIRRPHDERLRVQLAPPVAGSRLVMVRGEPGSGTSRSAWEAVADVLAEWPLEYPQTAAALVGRLEAGIPAGTVLWLGELGRYADADDGAAALGRLDDLFDEDGYLVLVDRAKDMIIRGGENIYPRELENLLVAHPDVGEVAVVGLPDEKWGETVAAFVRPAPGCKVNKDELFRYLRERLAPHKTPKHWFAVEQFPLTGSGKIQKFKLREQWASGDCVEL